MRHALIALAALAACTDPEPIGGPIDPLFVRAYNAAWGTGGACRPPQPFNERPSTLTIDEDGVLTWDPGGVRHIAWMNSSGAVQVEQAIESGWTRYPYSVFTQDGGATFGALLRWDVDGETRLCDVTLTPR